MPTRQKHLTDEQRAERRQADRDRLEQAARALLSSEGWQRWVKVRSTNGLSRYSFGNQLLIAMQRPDASYVAGFRAFLKLNRCVRKGERAIRIFAPMTIGSQEQDRTDAEPKNDGEQQTRTVFRAVSVFDVSQTDALPDRSRSPWTRHLSRFRVTRTRTCWRHSSSWRLSLAIRSDAGHSMAPLMAGAMLASTRSSSTTNCPRTPRFAFSSTRSRTPSVSATATTAAAVPRCWSTP